MTKSKSMVTIKVMVIIKKYDFGIDIGIDKELMTIDRLKLMLEQNLKVLIR